MVQSFPLAIAGTLRYRRFLVVLIIFFFYIHVGRVLFGFGGESLGVAQSAFTARFFRGRELALAFGVSHALRIQRILDLFC